MEPNKLQVLELFSGIGGMHFAVQFAALPATIVAAMDINTVANAVYKYNHKNINVKNNNIQILTAKQLQKLGINMLVMSPPCQPHTRQGLQRDLADKRSDALSHICSLLPKCTELEYILMENVKGFEQSLARAKFIEALQLSGFYWREFILSPTQFNMPNSRNRYYCLARKVRDFNIDDNHIWESLPMPIQPAKQTNVSEFLETTSEIAENYLLSDDVLNKRVWLLDIVNPTSTNTMCFTKGYTHYSEGTGSVFSPLNKEDIDNIFVNVKRIENEMTQTESDNDRSLLLDQRMSLLHSLQLRYLTPREVARLMSFPDTFNFPPEVTQRQKYRLLGNSINVRVVGELLKWLVE